MFSKTTNSIKTGMLALLAIVGVCSGILLNYAIYQGASFSQNIPIVFISMIGLYSVLILLMEDYR